MSAIFFLATDAPICSTKPCLFHCLRLEKNNAISIVNESWHYIILKDSFKTFNSQWTLSMRGLYKIQGFFVIGKINIRQNDVTNSGVNNKNLSLFKFRE